MVTSQTHSTSTGGDFMSKPLLNDFTFCANTGGSEVMHLFHTFQLLLISKPQEVTEVWWCWIWWHRQHPQSNDRVNLPTKRNGASVTNKQVHCRLLKQQSVNSLSRHWRLNNQTACRCFLTRHLRAKGLFRWGWIKNGIINAPNIKTWKTSWTERRSIWCMFLKLTDAPLSSLRSTFLQSGWQSDTTKQSSRHGPFPNFSKWIYQLSLEPFSVNQIQFGRNKNWRMSKKNTWHFIRTRT